MTRFRQYFKNRFLDWPLVVAGTAALFLVLFYQYHRSLDDADSYIDLMEAAYEVEIGLLRAHIALDENLISNTKIDIEKILEPLALAREKQQKIIRSFESDANVIVDYSSIFEFNLVDDIDRLGEVAMQIADAEKISALDRNYDLYFEDYMENVLIEASMQHKFMEDLVDRNLQLRDDSLHELGIFVGTILLFVYVVMYRFQGVIRAKRAQLLDSLAEKEAVFNTAIDAIVIINDRGVIETANYACKAVFGYTQEELVGKNIAMLMSGSDAQQHDGYLATYKQTGKRRILGQTGRELKAKRKDGEQIYIELGATEFTTGGRKRYTGLIRDVTQRKRFEQDLEAAKERAEHSEKVKTEFLAIMSHELRTPLNGILGMLELLSDTNMDDEGKEFVEVALGASQSLLNVLNDILDLTKMESEKLEFEQIPFDLRRMGEETVRFMQHSASLKHLALSCDFSELTTPVVSGDPNRVRQIVTNLLSNAIKFTEAGGATLKIATQPDSGDLLQVRISVTDTGIGMDEKTRLKLFNSFVQADSSITRKYGGTGLGLAICRRLVEQMGGEIGVNSEPGKGSTFWLLLRLPKGDALLSSGVAAAH